MEGLRARWRRVDRRRVDAAVVVLLFASTAVSMATKPLEPGQNAPTWWAYLLLAGLCLPFAMHRRRPVVALAVQCVVLLAYAPGAWPAYPGLPVFALVAGVALHCDRRRALLAAAASAGALVVAVRLQPASVQDSSTIVATLLAVAVAWLWGANLRARRARIAALEDRARLAEAEREDRARLAVAEERLRIARELHDVVAHAMSVVVVQSGVANHVMDSRPEAAREALAAIETTSRDALVEMRRLLGVLRRPSDDGREPSPGSLEPAPGFAGLEALAGHVRAAGLDVTLDLPDPWPEAPPGVQLTVHRLVQEGLTNVLRHGGPAARVVVRPEAASLLVEVCDGGRTAADGLPAVPAVTAGEELGSGHGLLGLRERVAVYGGEFEAGPLPGGGFRLRARVPLRPPVTAPRSGSMV